MNAPGKILRLLFTLCAALSFSACTSGGGGGDDDNNGQPAGDRDFVTDCGVVKDMELKNPINEQDGLGGFISQVITHNVLIFELNGGGRILVKLHGISDSVNPVEEERATTVLQGLLGAGTFFRPLEEGCEVVVEGGGTAVAGALISSTGISLNEAVLQAGAVQADFGDVCDVNLIAGCYDAIADENEEKVPETGANVTGFIWKPVAERDGKLVVLINPFAAEIVAGGEVLQNTGASNGFAQTSRSNRTGCAFGANVPVQAKDSSGRFLVFPGGQTTFTIPNGCNRVEF